MIASVGEIDQTFSRDKWSVRFRGIVVEKLNSDIYGGMNFLDENDITIRAKTGELKIQNKHTIYQTNMIMPVPPQMKEMKLSSCTITPPKKVLFPSYSPLWRDSSQAVEKHSEASTLDVILPLEFKEDKFVVAQPRKENRIKDWPPSQLCSVMDGKISIYNDSSKPLSVPRDVHLLDVVHTTLKSAKKIVESNPTNIHLSAHEASEQTSTLKKIGVKNAEAIDVSRAPKQLQDKLRAAHLKYANVFAPDLTIGYNGSSGPRSVRLQFADENRPQMSKCHVPKWSVKMTM